MDIFVVTENIPYEGSEVIGVFSNREKAEDFKTRCDDERRCGVRGHSDFIYKIKRHVLDVEDDMGFDISSRYFPPMFPPKGSYKPY